jgi:predicted ABC-type exoprotein transport system permease subunit
VILKILFCCFSFPEEIIDHRQVINLYAYLIKIVGPAFYKGYASEKLLRLFWIIPETGLLGYIFFLRNEIQLAINVKDTSLTHRSVPIILLSGRW